MKNEMEGAVHLFEALSGVDQELLERAEKEEEGAHKTGSAGEKRKRGSLKERRKIEKMLTAAACFAAACVGLWAVGKVSFDAGSSPEMMAGAGQKAAVAEDRLPEEAAEAYLAEGAGQEPPEAKLSGETGHAAKEELSEEVLSQGIADMEKLQPEALQAGQTVTLLSEQEARQVQLLGNYVPEWVPKGYAFEEAYSTDGGQKLFVSFAKGMDYIEMCICRDSGENMSFTDTDKAETYDVHLYQVPYADTVPEEYREEFDWPVFKSSDLTLEVVEARLKSYEDAGDTASSKGNFAVYYEETQVLVDFRGCGEAESIWQLFEELGK